MKAESTPVTIKLLDKEFRVACEPHEKEDLLASAQYLNAKMKEIRDNGRVVGADRVAIMAALNMAHELLKADSEHKEFTHAAGNRLRLLQNKIDNVLNKARQIEL
jgi:cell division protein ZapA